MPDLSPESVKGIGLYAPKSSKNRFTIICGELTQCVCMLFSLCVYRTKLKCLQMPLSVECEVTASRALPTSVPVCVQFGRRDAKIVAIFQ